MQGFFVAPNNYKSVINDGINIKCLCAARKPNKGEFKLSLINSVICNI